MAISMGTAQLRIGRKPKLWPGHQPKEYFYFNLRGQNGEKIAQSEQYTQKHNATEILEKYFPNFVVDDKAYSKFPPNVR